MALRRNSAASPPANGNNPVRGNSDGINLCNLSKRLKMLYDHWGKSRGNLWGSCSVLAIATPPPSDDLKYLKSSTLSIWLLGLEFPETIMVFASKQIHFLCGQKKASLLEDVKNERTARCLAGKGRSMRDSRAPLKTSTDLEYRTLNNLPATRDLTIQVDQKNEAVRLPIYGNMVSFHVATIRSITSQQDTYCNCCIRIIFVPGTTFSPYDLHSLNHQGSICLKEVSLPSNNPRHIRELVHQIKTLRRNVMKRQSEKAERATLVTQEKLQLASAKFKPIRLLEVLITPHFPGCGQKLPGTLEAHLNGFRYSMTRQEECVDIIYSNIKHAFFQPAKKEMITLLHFHLHNHIMVGNKKTKDVQFYVKVMDIVQTLGCRKRSVNDPNEIEEERQQRERKNKICMDFQGFVNQVHELWGLLQFQGLHLNFNQPLRELGFHGVPHKTSAFIMPTLSCLVELIEMPRVVITLAEIQIINLERIGLGQKHFDMIIVFKDFKRDVFQISSIPLTSLNGIKEWLKTANIIYYESKLNLNWKQILKTVTNDPQSFIDEGGWEFLNTDSTDSGSRCSVNSDQHYEPEEGDEESDSESLVESEDDDEAVSNEDSEERKGKTWEDLEREYRNAGREEGENVYREAETKKKKKAFVQNKPLPSSNIPKRPMFR